MAARVQEQQQQRLQAWHGFIGTNAGLAAARARGRVGGRPNVATEEVVPAAAVRLLHYQQTQGGPPNPHV
ncbi:hypothetical protein [Streptomyces sp. NRRL S-118]|uniref:hypothetical protein n=1 Tax=Streptomyces sp. NRRL S-118 TaxID=1463881 RepID=UPI00099B2E02|nr:hypothetical protein [Streptomyces sp. NRRL S-118]